jgi:hypothetical protein
MFVILKCVTSTPSAGLRLMTRPEVVWVLTVVEAFVTDGVSATDLRSAQTYHSTIDCWRRQR